MKDPLQKELTEYEILNIQEDAKKEEIQPAFIKALKGKNRNKAAGARKILLNEIERIKVDFFQYDNIFFEKLEKGLEIEKKLISQRISVANDWQLEQSNLFPEISSIAHSLNVLWFWTALNVSENCFQKLSVDPESIATDDLNKLENAWNKAIAYFTASINSDLFLNNWLKSRNYFQNGSTNNIKSEIKEKLIQKVENKLQYYYGNSVSTSVPLKVLFQKLLDNLKLELSISNKIRSLKINVDTKINGSQRVEGLGKIFLEEYGYIEKVRNIISDLNSASNNEKINDLLIALSPFANIQSLVNKKQFKSALDEIEKLPQADKTTPELKKLKQDSIVGLARFCISGGVLTEFLEFKNNYLKARTVATSKVVQIIADDIFKLVASLKNVNQDKMIELLAWVNSNAPEHKNIRLKLANLYLERGIQTYNKGQRAYEKEPTEKNRLLMEKGFEDAEKAKKLNPTEKRILQNHDVMKRGVNISNPVISEASKNNGEGVKLLSQANNDLKAGNVNEAKEKIQKAKSLFEAALKVEPNNNVFKDNRKIAVDYLQQITKVETDLKNQQKARKDNDDGVLILNGCQNDYVKYMQAKNTLKQIKQIKLPDGAQLNAKGQELLSESLDTVNSLVDSLKRRIEEAFDFFESALDMFPNNETYKKNRDYAYDMYAEVQTFEEIIYDKPAKKLQKGYPQNKPAGGYSLNKPRSSYTSTTPKRDYSRKKPATNYTKKSTPKYNPGRKKTYNYSSAKTNSTKLLKGVKDVFYFIVGAIMFLLVMVLAMASVEVYKFLDLYLDKGQFLVSAGKIAFATLQTISFYLIIIKGRQAWLFIWYLIGIAGIWESGLGMFWFVLYCIGFVVSVILYFTTRE